MDQAAKKYQVYLLRLWPVEVNGECWRASIEQEGTGRRQGFEDLEALFDFLRQQAAGQEPAGEGSAPK